jgi:hypothetical protein
MQSHKDKRDSYEARVRALDKGVLAEWQAAQEKLGVRQGQQSLVVFGIIFNDRLWDGVTWAPGNPRRAVTRLNALPKEAVERLARAAGVEELPFIAANALITVDGVFTNEAFQLAVFDRALPIAQQRMAK